MTHSIKTLFVTIMACIACNTLDAQTQIIAHRGYWDTAGSAQNSITSLKLADKKSSTITRPIILLVLALLFAKILSGFLN